MESVKKKIAYLFFILAVFYAGYLVLFTYGDMLFGKLSERMFDDTRSIADLSFLDDIQTGSTDFYIGKGISGTYYSPHIESNGTLYREHIESGYLELILKGGVILVILYALFVIPAIFLGLFRSKNNMSKLFAIYCILFSGILYGVGSYFTFGMRYILLLFCVFNCYNREMRKLTNSEIQKILNDE
jgi:hypothetical protein